MTIAEPERLTAPPPWTLTPEDFGRGYAPLRRFDTDPPGFYYPWTDAYPTRAEAVAAGHQHLVAKALDAGQTVPDSIRALYPDLTADSDLAALCAPAPNIADHLLHKGAASADLNQGQRPQELWVGLALATAQAHGDRLLTRLAETVTATHQEAMEHAGRVQTVLAKALAQQDAVLQTMVHAWREDCAAQTERADQLHCGLVKALVQQDAVIADLTTTTRETAAQHLHALQAGQAAIREGQAHLAATLDHLAAALTRPPPSSGWRFEIRRDAQGFIASVDATRRQD